MPRPTRFSPEVRARAVRMVMEHEAAHDSQWAAIASIAEKIGCSAETLRKWVRQAERDAGARPGLRRRSASASSSLSGRIPSCGVRTRFYDWRRRISRRRSSTADTSDGRIYR